MAEHGISVISSRATDILLRPNGTVINEQEGGPILFIERALREANVPFDSHEGERIRVEIEVHDEGEYGRIVAPPIRRHLGELSAGQWCLVSTLLDEWVLDGRLPGHLMVDIQGYVRGGSEFGKKQQWALDEEVAKGIFCLKGTKEEVRYLHPDVSESQKSRLLVVTRGAEGATIYYKGNEYNIPARTIHNLPDTVGAGDTFFANLAIALYCGDHPQRAAIHATQKTAEFLVKKPTS